VNADEVHLKPQHGVLIVARLIHRDPPRSSVSLSKVQPEATMPSQPRGSSAEGAACVSPDRQVWVAVEFAGAL